jgi:hypothetical protein
VGQGAKVLGGGLGGAVDVFRGRRGRGFVDERCWGAGREVGGEGRCRRLRWWRCR